MKTTRLCQQASASAQSCVASLLQCCAFLLFLRFLVRVIVVVVVVADRLCCLCDEESNANQIFVAPLAGSCSLSLQATSSPPHRILFAPRLFLLAAAAFGLRFGCHLLFAGSSLLSSCCCCCFTCGRPFKMSVCVRECVCHQKARACMCLRVHKPRAVRKVALFLSLATLASNFLLFAYFLYKYVYVS